MAGTVRDSIGAAMRFGAASDGVAAQDGTVGMVMADTLFALDAPDLDALGDAHPVAVISAAVIPAVVIPAVVVPAVVVPAAVDMAAVDMAAATATTRAFSGKVDTDFPQKMRSNQESRARL
jgi:hypothetical protein